MFNPRLVIYFLLSVALLTFSVYWRGRDQSPNVQAIANTIEKNIEREAAKLNTDAKKIIQAINDSTAWPASNYIFILYDSSQVLQWSTNRMVPDTRDVHSDTLRLVSNGGSYFLVKSFPINEHDIHLNGYILVQERYPIQNQYLGSKLNSIIFPLDDIDIQPNEPSESIAFSGVALFHISIGSRVKVYQSAWIGWIALIAGGGLLFYASWILILSWKRKGLAWVAAIFAFLVLLTVRLLMVYGEYPGNIKSNPIFDSNQFASSAFSNSIGNFFLNALAFLGAAWIVYSLISKTQFRKWAGANQVVQFLGITFFLLLAFGFHLLPFLYIETIFGNSVVNLDVSQQLYFDSVRLLAFGCVVLSNLTGYYFFLTFVRNASNIARRQFVLFSVALVVAAVSSWLGYHFNTGRAYEIPVLATTVHIFILYFGFVSSQLRFLVVRRLSLVFVAVIILAAQAAFTIRLQTEKRQQKAMLRYGNTFLAERDVLGEYLLSQAALNIETDVFIQQQFTNPFNRLASISQKIKRGHLSNYFDRYEVQVSLFDSKGQSIGGTVGLSLDSLRSKMTPVSMEHSSIFIGRQVSVQYLNQYGAIIPIQSTVPGFVVLNLSLREVSPTTVFPRLLLDDRFRDYASGVQYSHAVYQNGVLQNSAGAFKYELNDFRKLLSDPLLFNGGLKSGGFYHVGLEDWNGRVAVVSMEEYSWFNLVANFSFLFLLGLAVCFIGLALANVKNLRFTRLTYSNRIQLYVYGAMILPLVIISATTLRLNSFSEQEHADAENMSKAERLAQNLSTVYLQNPDNLQDEVLIQAKAVGIDVNVFSPAGVLLNTSQPEIYTSLLVSRLAQPEALKRIQQGNYLFSLNDQVGKLRFQNTYAAMRSPATGEVIAILSAPFFESQQEGEMNQLRLASNIWTVFAIVFMVFYLLSFVALNWLTKPLQVIASSLRRTTLSGTNRKLSWNSKDEIGTMVTEYNKLVDNLEISKAELARKQREAAWREMARQVAHEIKNPLTPIKLTLQQMELTMLKDKVNNEKSIQSIRTVLHQVDILNEIASSFSAFAQMPELKLERANIKQLIQESVALYHNTKPHSIIWNQPDEPVWVMADAKLFARIFGNIILNAFQAGDGNPVTVAIDIYLTGSHVRIIFKDNAPGMPQEILDKVFIPYFSTKETGSGLGLAIARQGIDQAGGRIWCESEVGKGSIFFIELPIVN